ncbi:hypothetical protein EMPG_10632 [Blastomyces silverae]|uniref:NACHT domain-containing protein n=1 Tax=Blastomyces silverae TaxID=2060906 RepID=A0A0H1B3B9_9EURO|nr:hypothetical protein EMPG_10632 [Blastomyces silverae]
MTSHEANVTVGWIAPMALELTPAVAILENHEKVLKHETLYHVGLIARHWVVMVVCPRIGTASAATVLADMRRSFPNIKHVLVVGIAGGMPYYGPSMQEQIVLGDVVVGCPQGSEGGVAHYEFGAWEGENELTPRGHTLHPSDALLSAVNNLRSDHRMRVGTKIPQILSDLRKSLAEEVLPEFEDPGSEQDYLFPDNYPHRDRGKLCEGLCDLTTSKRRNDRGAKATRKEDWPRIHYGTIGSANALVISSEKRNELYAKHKTICIEMESAGVMGNHQALVVRGICDYADSHKNKKWQNYAAATAAAYAKEVLLLVPPARLDERVASEGNRDQKPPKTCLQSLAFLQMNFRSKEITETTKGTCEWLLQHRSYKDWVASDRGLLWIKGKPGSGKSTLLKYALDHSRARQNDLVLSFFFHGRGDTLQRTPLGLFRSLLHQVLKQEPSSLQDLTETFKENCDGFGQPGQDWHWHQEDLQRFLESSLLKVLEVRSVWLFIDALDECGKESAVQLFQWLKSLLRTLPPTTSQSHIFVTCRHFPILDRDCEFEVCPEHENKEDIATFVRDQLSCSPMLTASPIPALISSRASGVFLWARLVVDKVKDLDRQRAGLKKIKAEIHSIPQDLRELYKTLIQGMSKDSVKLIQWICFALRPLSIDELRWAMVIDVDSPHRSLRAYQDTEDIPDNDSMRIQVQALSRGLAEVAPSSRTQVVQFIHQSVKDFFVEDGLLMINSSMSIDTVIGMAHHQLSRICIHSLAMMEISEVTSYNWDDFPFLAYATTSWVEHTKECDARRVAQDDLLELFAWPSNDLVELWVRVCQTIYVYPQRGPPDGTSLIHIMSKHGVLGPVAAILQRAQGLRGIDRTDRPCETPRPWTAKLLPGMGNVKVYSNSKDSLDRTPLSYASENGHEAMVKLLLTAGEVDVDVKDKHGRTSLSYASGSGHEAIVKLLLTTGEVDVDSKGFSGWTPLFYASANGHEAIVKLLLATDEVDVEATDDDGQTPLSITCERGSEAVVKLLLTIDGVNVNSKDWLDWTPLFCASSTGHEAIVKLLLTTGEVDIDAKDEDGWTSLSHASARGHESVIKLLLLNKADVNSTSDIGRTALSYASENGHEAVVKLLLSSDEVNVDVRDQQGWTPLSLAYSNEHKAIVKLLLAELTDID